jgi:hypothetical protein
MKDDTTRVVLEKLDHLRGELAELAFTMECRGHLDAADVAIVTSARVTEICDEIASGRDGTDGAETPEPAIVGD